MIRFEAASKRFPGSERSAVDALDLTVAEGTTCVLLGPSGCGKSTSLRMVNRLVEPDAGRFLLGGSDVAQADPVRLRRGMGYVLQDIGFPHESRRKQRCDRARTARLAPPAHRPACRRDTHLFGLDPAIYRDRLPASLSGGQRQRVGWRVRSPPTRRCR